MDPGIVSYDVEAHLKILLGSVGSRELVFRWRCGSSFTAKECETGFLDALMSGIEVLI